MKEHVSQYFGNLEKGHAQFEFVDVNLRDDNELFIDPCLLETSRTEWCIQANAVLQSFMDALVKSLREGNDGQFKYLLSHAREQNATKLGYGNGENGHGSSPDGLFTKLSPLKRLIKEVPMTKAMDIPVLVRDFAEDGMSDLITNIISDQLQGFTVTQCKKYEQTHLTDFSYWHWDMQQQKWINKTQLHPTYNSKRLVLVPKEIVRRQYVFGVDNYLKRIILERQKRESRYADDKGKERFVPKKELEKAIRKDTPHWRYEYTEGYTKAHPEMLDEYHAAIPSFYINKGLSDEELDALIY